MLRSGYFLRQGHGLRTAAVVAGAKRVIVMGYSTRADEFRKGPGLVSRRWSSSASSKRYVQGLVEMYSQPAMNMTDLMIGRHSQSNPALHYVENDTVITYTYADCERYSNQLALLLAEQGLRKGDPIAVMLPKSPQLVFAALAIWRLGYVFVPLFAAFEETAIKIRLEDSRAKVVITDTENRHKFDFTTDVITKITTIINANLDTKVEQKSRISPMDVVYSLTQFQKQTNVGCSVPTMAPVSITPQDTICLLYTSGTTGLPKGVSIPSFALASFHAYMEQGLGLHSDIKNLSLRSSTHAGGTEIAPQGSEEGGSTGHNEQTQIRTQRYLSIADPAWAYGLYYNLIGPLLLGIPPTYLAGGFDPPKLLRALAKGQITHFAAAPSAYRALCAYDQAEDTSSTAREHKKQTFAQLNQHLLCASSAGEPLNPEIIDWWRSKMSGRSIADHYGQSETGMTVNWHWKEGINAPRIVEEGEEGGEGGVQLMSQEWTKKGSMGKSMAGFRMVCVAHTKGVVENEVMNEPAELAVDLTASPLMWFRGYLNNSQRTQEALSACRRYYLTGDTVTHKRLDDVADSRDGGSGGGGDSDNIFWFSTRKDDVIKSSGYRIGPFDVENSLISDPRVAEVAVVGMPDIEGLRGEIVAAFVVLHEDYHADEGQHKTIAKELQQLVRTTLSKHCYPRRVFFLSDLPKTPSGKIQRFKLKQSADHHIAHH